MCGSSGTATGLWRPILAMRPPAQPVHIADCQSTVAQADDGHEDVIRGHAPILGDAALASNGLRHIDGLVGSPDPDGSRGGIALACVFHEGTAYVRW